MHCLAASLSARTRWESSQLCPRLPIAEFRGGDGWQRKTAGQREGEMVCKGEKGGWKGREGWGREGRKQRKVRLCPTRN